MNQEITVPAMGESVTEAIIAEWLKANGDYVKRNEPVVVLESDKANFEVVAEAAGTLAQQAAEGDTVSVGAIIGSLDTSAAPSQGGETAPQGEVEEKQTAPQQPAKTGSGDPNSVETGDLSPAVRRLVEEKGLDPQNIQGTGRGGRLTKEDALKAADSTPTAQAESEKPAKSAIPNPPQVKSSLGDRGERRQKMSTLRKRIAERLVSAQQTAAILTTFNEIDMSGLMRLRTSYKEAFKERFEISLGFMGIFTKAVCEALKFVPAVGAFIEGDELIFHDACNIGVAVGTPRGLVVPVIRDADLMSLAEIEQSIRHFAIKGREGKMTIDDMQGGNFTISNGGVYGSLMSTPILNPPQSGILGMHKIEDRPIALNGEIVIRPMMYVALSYDHRIIDGQEAVTFLVKVKEFVEDPARLILGV